MEVEIGGIGDPTPLPETTASALFSSYDLRNRLKAESVLFSAIPPNQDVYHTNYLRYLDICWKCHQGVVLTPDIVWFTIMSEVAASVVKNPEDFRSLFTTSPDKKVIQSPLSPFDPNFCQSFVDILHTMVPLNTDIFVPSFSTTTIESAIAIASVFLETISPYYSMRGGCGIPRVRLEGTREDWQLIVDNLTLFLEAVDTVNGKWIRAYLERVIARCKTLVDPPTDPEFWRQMYFYKDVCMSGTVIPDVSPSGWFLEFFTRGAVFAQDFPSHVSVVPFTMPGTDRDFALCAGVLSSVYEGPARRYLVPAFSHVVVVRKKAQ